MWLCIPTCTCTTTYFFIFKRQLGQPTTLPLQPCITLRKLDESSKNKIIETNQECCSNSQSSSAWDSLCWCILYDKIKRNEINIYNVLTKMLNVLTCCQSNNVFYQFLYLFSIFLIASFHLTNCILNNYKFSLLVAIYYFVVELHVVERSCSNIKRLHPCWSFP